MLGRYVGAWQLGRCCWALLCVQGAVSCVQATSPHQIRYGCVRGGSAVCCTLCPGTTLTSWPPVCIFRANADGVDIVKSVHEYLSESGLAGASVFDVWASVSDEVTDEAEHMLIYEQADAANAAMEAGVGADSKGLENLQNTYSAAEQEQADKQGKLDDPTFWHDLAAQPTVQVFLEIANNLQTSLIDPINADVPLPDNPDGVGLVHRPAMGTN